MKTFSTASPRSKKTGSVKKKHLWKKNNFLQPLPKRHLWVHKQNIYSHPCKPCWVDQVWELWWCLCSSHILCHTKRWHSSLKSWSDKVVMTIVVSLWLVLLVVCLWIANYDELEWIRLNSKNLGNFSCCWRFLHRFDHNNTQLQEQSKIRRQLWVVCWACQKLPLSSNTNGGHT